MPALKRRMIFISHAWDYSAQYQRLEEWLNKAPYFKWSNCSVPSNDALPDKTSEGLSEAIKRQINPSQIVIILGGMYAAHSDWIKYEIDVARSLKKPIVAIKPWGQKRIPEIVRSASCTEPVGWNSKSVVDAVRKFSW